MMTSTALAIGTSAGTLTVTAVSALLMGALAAYTLQHHKRVFDWMKKIRAKDETNSAYDKPTEWLADLYKAQCRLAHKPCRTEDFDDVAQIGNMIKGIADHTEAIHTELAKVVERVEEYLNTALPEPTPAVKVPLAEHRSLLAKAMKQESARSELARAIVTAQNKITAVRRG
ncbi:hypothetical protein [Streptomyces sp. YS415]|uniref:hypothetical protein n=1 Tax=Streptomyces sp. YS415 TaxID=2944806 RepID=UPI0020225C0F|nr:hypothetical protein [Streptomyces sp. YS415]MCL7429822.1 hypothetical protein [Streptomyces sp. YS415]